MLTKIQLDPGFWTKTSWIQLLYGLWVNMSHLGIGLAFGLPAVQVPQLASVDSSVPITRYQAAWIASILTLFSPIGCLISGFVMDRFGRRVMIILSQGPMCLGWLWTAYAKSPNQIIIGRAITGMGCGLAMAPPRIYTSEISLPNMRGVIGAFPSLALSLGISIQAGLGNFFSWRILCVISSMFTLFNLVVFFLLPETPYYVLKTGTARRARLTLKKFRGSNYDVDAEMTQLLEFKADNDIRKLSLKENIKALFTRSACIPFGIINMYNIITQASGVSCILTWAVEILVEAQSSYNVHVGYFLLAVTRLVVGTMTSILLFKVGRKTMAITSATGVSFICFSIGFFVYYNDDPSMVPQCLFMLYMAFASLGYYTLPFLMASELYPLQVRGLLGGITVSLTSFLIFGSTKMFPLIMDNIGLAYTMIIFGACSLMGAIFLYFYLPETKELTLQEIEEYYNSRRSTLMSQRRFQTMQSLKQISGGSKPKSNAELKTVDEYKTLHMSSQMSSKILAKLESKKKIATLLEQRYNNTEAEDKSSSSIESLTRDFSSVVNKERISIKDALRSEESLKIANSIENKESHDENVKLNSVENDMNKESKKIDKEKVPNNEIKINSTQNKQELEKSNKDLIKYDEPATSSKKHLTDYESKKSTTTLMKGKEPESSKEHFIHNESKISSKELSLNKKA